MSKIYLFCVPSGMNEDVIGYALAEDGTGLGNHYSSNRSFSQFDMGYTSDRKHHIYHQHYPDGFELVWLEYDNLATHAEYQAAFRLNQEKEIASNMAGQAALAP